MELSRISEAVPGLPQQYHNDWPSKHYSLTTALNVTQLMHCTQAIPFRRRIAQSFLWHAKPTSFHPPTSGLLLKNSPLTVAFSKL